MVFCSRLRALSTDAKLRLVLVASYALTLTCTLITCLSLGWSVRIFGEQCPIYANMVLTPGAINNTIIIGENTVWGSLILCNFCIFSAVCGTIMAIMWFWFYFLLSNFKMEDKAGISEIFGEQCPIYANMVLTPGAINNTIINGENTVWGSLTSSCNFHIILAVCGTIMAIMCFWFYFRLSNFKMEDKDGIRLPPDTRLVLPSMIANVPMAVVSLIVACMITDGRSHLCGQVSISIADDCNVAGSREWHNFPDGREAFNYIQVAQWGAWFWFLSLVLTVLVGAYRINRLVQDGSEYYNAFSITSFSRSSSRSSLTSHEDFYSSADDNDVIVEEGGFANPNFIHPGDVSETRLERVAEEVTCHLETPEIVVTCPMEEEKPLPVTGRLPPLQMPQQQVSQNEASIKGKANSKHRAKNSQHFE